MNHIDIMKKKANYAKIWLHLGTEAHARAKLFMSTGLLDSSRRYLAIGNYCVKRHDMIVDSMAIKRRFRLDKLLYYIIAIVVSGALWMGLFQALKSNL